MLTRIALKNFMSHKDTVLELGPGLTVVTGPNNCGKSALVAALQIVCRNHLDDLVVRHGEKECSVTLWTDDPHEITWRRKGKDVSYTIDGVEYSRLKGKPPEVLHDLLKLPEIVEGDATFDLHFGLQKEPIFLLDKAGSQAAKFFASSSDAARLMAMQALHKKRTGDRKVTLKNLKIEEARLQAQLERLQPAGALRDDLEKTAEAYQALSQSLDQEATLAQSWERLQHQECEVAIHSQQLALLSTLPPIPVLTPTDELEELLLEVDHTQGRMRRLTAVVTTCKPLVPPPALADDAALESLVGHLGQARTQAAQYTRQTDILHRLTSPPTPTDDTALEASVRNLTTCRAGFDAAASALDEARQAEETANRQLKRWMKQHPECPVCHRPWEEASLVLGGHAHG